MTQDSMKAVRTQLAPHGFLSVVINYGNGVLAQKDQATGEPAGVSTVLARKLAALLDLPLQLHTVESAGDGAETLKTGLCDLGFLAIDPKRSTHIGFTRPYVIIEGGYLCRKDAPFSSIEDVDRAGVRIAVGKNAVYDLFLSRTLRQAELVRAQTMPGAIDLYREQGLELVAGIRSALLAFAADHHEYKVLDGSFVQIEQAMGVPHHRGETVLPFLNQFLNEMLINGFIGNQLELSGQDPHFAATPPTTTQ